MLSKKGQFFNCSFNCKKLLVHFFPSHFQMTFNFQRHLINIFFTIYDQISWLEEVFQRFQLT